MNTDAAAAGDARRALRAILAGDVVGYSRHMGEAEEATLAALARHRAVIDPLIVQHHGGIFTTAGDSVLAAFETPSQAVRCALAVQENLVALHREATVPRRLIFRIGVHAGDILVRGHAPIGDAINVAARLESAATPGRVLISREVLSHLEPELADRFRFRGNQMSKDQPLPLATYEGGGDPTSHGRKRGGILSPWWGAFIATSGLVILGYLFAVYDGLAFFHAAATGRNT